MKSVMTGFAVSALLLTACSGASSDLTPESAAPEKSEESSAAPPHHPDFVRKLRDPAHYELRRTAAPGRSSILSQCGTTDDKQQVNDYNGTLGVSQDFVRTYKGPVGASEFGPTAGSADKWCSGILIANDLFLTASHCWSDSNPTTHVSFNYERRAGSTTLLEEKHYRISGVVEDGLGGLDYAILRLEGNPGSVHGIVKTKSTDPATRATLAIIGHPNREPKQVEAGTLGSISGDYFRYGNIDTEGGNSGSGILDANGNVVGVHTNGGCTSTGGSNSGVRLSRIAAVSNVIN